MNHLIRLCVSLALTVLFSTTLFTACQQPQTPPSPIAVALLYDVSLSAEQNGVSKLDLESIERLLALLKKRGGVLAFCEINSKSRVQPLLRVHLEPVSCNLEKRALVNTHNESELTDFSSKIEPSLGQRRAKKSDVFGALSRTALFFNEPLVAEMERILIIISDGKHDAAPLTKPVLPPDLVVITIGVPPKLAEKLFDNQPVVIFESVDGAIQYLESSPAFPKPLNKGDQ
jgi:hypothetical protein